MKISEINARFLAATLINRLRVCSGLSVVRHDDIIRTITSLEFDVRLITDLCTVLKIPWYTRRICDIMSHCWTDFQILPRLEHAARWSAIRWLVCCLGQHKCSTTKTIPPFLGCNALLAWVEKHRSSGKSRKIIFRPALLLIEAKPLFRVCLARSPASRSDLDLVQMTVTWIEHMQPRDCFMSEDG